MKNPRQKEKKRGDTRRRKVTFDEHKTEGEEMRRYEKKKRNF